MAHDERDDPHSAIPAHDLAVAKAELAEPSERWSVDEHQDFDDADLERDDDPVVDEAPDYYERLRQHSDDPSSASSTASRLSKSGTCGEPAAMSAKP